MPSLLFLSNGTGEDRIACALIDQWKRQRPQDQLAAMAMVGPGTFYRQAGIPLLAPTLTLPSAGFAYLHPARLWQDVRAGLLPHLLRQWRALQRARPVDLVIAVGDIVPLAAGCSLGSPLVFVACALSDYYLTGERTAFDPWQRRLMQKRCQLVFPRDELTGRHLRQRGVPAIDAGNPMLDCLDYQAGWAYVPSRREPVAILPGSHADALANFQQILALIEPWSQGYDFLVVCAPTRDPAAFAAPLAARGWQTAGDGLVWSRPPSSLYLLPAAAFGHVVATARAAIGLAGTGNEQLAGHGIPVLSFATRGPQYTPRFAQAQQRLLGPGLTYLQPCSSDALHRALVRALSDPAYRQLVASTARERFGLPGASARIVDAILAANMLQQNQESLV